MSFDGAGDRLSADTYCGGRQQPSRYFISVGAGQRQMRSMCIGILTAMLLTGCSKEPEYTDQQGSCIAKQYKQYDPKQLSQCVNVCKNCFAGTSTTCTTSCNLRGAR